MSARAASTALLLHGLALACTQGDAIGDAGSDVVDGAGDRGDAGSAAGAAPIAGTFLLKLVAEVPATAGLDAVPAHVSLNGQTTRGATPEARRWTATAQDGACTLFEPSLSVCDPACTGGAVCVADGVCAAYPPGVDLGAVSLRGVRKADGSDGVDLTKVGPKHNYSLGSTKLAYPPFEAGSEVTLDAEGGELEPFSISTAAIEPLELIGEQDLPFRPDAPTELRWVPQSVPGSRIEIVFEISHHGGSTAGEIRCQSDDRGALDVSGELAGELIALGVAGFPTVQIARVSKATAEVAGGSVALELISELERDLRIDGLVSCDHQSDAQDACPDGQVCQPDDRCQ